MPLKLVISFTALHDIQNGIDWYKVQQNNLGKKFERQVNVTLKKILKFPFSASFAYEEVRYKVMEIFPYIILYEVLHDTIYILRLFHDRQEQVY